MYLLYWVLKYKISNLEECASAILNIHKFYAVFVIAVFRKVENLNKNKIV